MEGRRRRKVNYSYHLVAGAGAEGFIDIITTPKGKVLDLKLIHVGFPLNTAGKLQVAIYYGGMKVYPDEGYMSGDNMTFVDEVELRYFSQEPVRLYYKNLDTEASKEAYVKLEGELG